MLRGIIIVLLTVGVVGTGYWGYKEHQEKKCGFNSSGKIAINVHSMI